MVVNGTSTAGGRWLKNDYPEKDLDDPVLRCEENLVIEDEALLDNGW